MQVVDPVSITPDPTEANEVLQSLEEFRPIADSYIALSNLLDVDLLNDFMAAFTANGVDAIVSDVNQLRRETNRLNTYHPNQLPQIKRFPCIFDIEESFVGTIYDFTADLSDSDSPITDLEATITGDMLVGGLELKGFVLSADGTQTVSELSHNFQVSDALDGIASRDFTMRVRADGSAPLVLPEFGLISDVTVTLGEAFPFEDHSVAVTNSAQLQAPITITTAVDPVGSGLVFSNGVRSGTAAEIGTYEVLVTATDLTGAMGQQAYAVTVNPSQPPVWQPLPPLRSDNGDPPIVFNLAPLVTPGVTISNVAGAPANATLNGLIITIPSLAEGEGIQFFQIQYTAINGAGEETVSPVQFITLGNPFFGDINL